MGSHLHLRHHFKKIHNHFNQFYKIQLIFYNTFEISPNIILKKVLQKLQKLHRFFWMKNDIKIIF